MSWQDYISPVATSDGVYYVDGNRICLFDGEDYTTILENTYYTDYEKEIYPDEKNLIGKMIISDNLIYVICPIYFFTYDINSKEISEPVNMSTCPTWAFCVNGGYAFYSTEDMELFACDLNTNEIKKLEDKVGQVCSKTENIFYIKWEGETPILYRAEKNGSEAKKLIEDCYVNYQLTDKGIYYQSYLTKECYFYQFENTASKKLNFNGADGEKYEVSEYLYLYSTGASDSVFCMDTTNNYFIFEDGNTESRTIKIGDRYSVWN